MRAIKIKTRNFATLFFSLILTLAVFSQISAAKPQTTSDVVWGGGLNKADWMYSKSNNDISAYLGKKSSTLPTVRYQKGADYLEFSLNKTAINNQETNISASSSVSLETDTKTPNTPTLFYRNILSDIDATYQITNIPFRVKEEIVLQSKILNLSADRQDLKSKNLNFVFDATTNTKPVKRKDGSIAFFGENGEYLFQLDKPFMVDAKGIISNDVNIDIVSIDAKRHRKSFDETDIPNFQSIFNDLILKYSKTQPFKIQNLPIDRQGNAKRLPMSFDGGRSYQIILKADTSWLNDPNRVYPVIIDPTVTHNADSNFTGQMNRIADNDSTTSTQLESSYPEATKDPHTVLLLHFNEANGATAGIKDYASTTRVITVNGNASTTNAVTQLGLGNSAAFDGTTDYFSVPDSDDWNFGSGDFSIETWVRFNTVSASQMILDQDGAGAARIYIYFSATTGLNFRFANSATTVDTNQGNTNGWATGVWYHLAIVRNGSNINVYRNSVSIASNTISIAGDDMAATLEIGRNSAAAGEELNGYLDSLRILKGRALTPEEIKAAASRRPYAVYTSPVVDAAASVSWNTVNWTEGGVNTGNGEQPYNTGSLVAQWDFNDTSGTTLTASSSGSCTTACNGTLTNFAYTASQDQATTTTGWTANNKKWGAGALMFDGSNDYVSVPDSADWDFGTGDFSIEAWARVNSSSASANYLLDIAASESVRITIYLDRTSDLIWWGPVLGNGKSGVKAIIDNKWAYFTLVRSSGVLKGYINGIENKSISDTTNYTGITNFNIGERFTADTSFDFNGIFDSVRIYKGRALSASETLSNYNVGNIEIQTRTGASSDPNDGTWEAWKPTTGEIQLLSMDSDKGNWNAPEQIDGYTKLLLHMDGVNGGTSFPNSATTTHTVTANGNASTTNAQSKFGGASGLFDGTGDYLEIPDSNDWDFGTGDFTIDFWVRFNSYDFDLLVAHGGQGVVSTDNVGWSISIENGASRLDFRNYVSPPVSTIQFFGAWAPALNTWNHVAVVRSGTTFYAFINGLQTGSVVDTDAIAESSFPLRVGRSQDNAGDLNGWVDELRISKGIARWTSNFTPPPRAYGSNVKADNETTLKQEGTASTKFTIGAPQVDGNTVALWHFEETGTTTGTYLYDETANNNDATTTGTTVVDGIFGKGRKFGTNGDYLSVADSANWDLGSSFSIDFWINRYNLTDIHWLGHYGDGTGGDDGWYVAQTGTNIDFRTNDNTLILGTAHGMSVNTWNYVTYTGDGSNLRLYINGILKGSAALSSVQVSARPLIIGSYAHSPGGAIAMNGTLDELRITNGRALSPDEIAETYRMGANHHLTRQVSAVDLSGANKLAFNVAADRPGTYLEAMLGESDYANYELASSTLALSTTTVLYIKGDEIASSTSLKDSSFSGKAITANGNARTAGGGKIGNSVYFDGTGDYLSVATNADWNFGTGDWAIDLWHKSSSDTNFSTFISIGNANKEITLQRNTGSGGIGLYLKSDDSTSIASNAIFGKIDNSNWQYIALIRNGNTVTGYINGVASGTWNVTGKSFNLSDTSVYVGIWRDVINYLFTGNIDEIRIIKGTALTADQIRQAYEYGLRTHPITIDFGATLQTSDLISSATDYNFTLTATTSGLSATTSGLYLGDTIIIKENLGGTEYTAQGTVNAINTATGAITVPSWDTGSTFPASNGYSPNATVFKWQREYFDITGSLSTHRDAVTNLTLRPTNGAEGRTIYLDDFRYNTNYLTASSSSAITSSNNRYLQYRAIFTSTDTFVSPFLTAFNTLYTALANSFPAIIGISGGGFLSF